MSIATHRPICQGESVDSSPFDMDTFAEIAKALSHPARLCIVRRFSDGQTHVVREIVECCGLAQSTVSEHLRILREAGVLVAIRDGASFRYDLRRPLLARFARTAAYLTAEPSILTSVR